MTILGYLLLTAFCLISFYTITEYFVNLRPTRFVYKPSELNEKVRKALKKLPRYKPTWYLPGPYLKLLASLGPDYQLGDLFEHHIFRFSEGGQAALDFYPKNDVKDIRRPKNKFRFHGM